MIEQALRDILTEDSTVKGIVGSNVFYGYAQDTAPLPYVLISLVAAQPQYNMTEELTDRQTTYSFDCYASTQLAGIQLANAVVGALGSYNGEKSSVNINGIFFLDFNDIVNHFAENEQSSNYGRSLTADVHYDI